jgi:hypothetical protein
MQKKSATSDKTQDSGKEGKTAEKRYSIRPSTSNDWIMLTDLETGLEVDVELRVLDYCYDCVPKMEYYAPLKKMLPCSFICCYTGCYASQEEIDKVNAHIEKIIPYLSEDGKKTMKENNNKFWDEDDNDPKEKLFKIICTPHEWEINPSEEKNYSKYYVSETGYPIRCVFLMDNGYCAVHCHLVDIGLDWVKDKFNICTTFPLDLRPQDNTIAFMKDFDTFTLQLTDCISDFEERKKQLGMGQIIDTCKYSIVDRYGESFWETLNEFAKDFRAGKIKIAKFYRKN